ncbi:hypothetical protein ACPOL_6789 (plasmid) [Acidisarcina polymorpha]|uniref:Replication initiator protein A n=1 Tax=Acidisarcina polymorpha TaxID=2211140 RepID=A0A2Z5GAF9_9BACT|nr:replication initiator protein A [Acidisarcina polymorpha]AXC15999.1 hypothetical protein ACPOL_6789 [Acidisarcina polymorpha]
MVNRDGKKIRVSAEFRSSETLGLPSTSDRDKYMAFMKLAMETKLKMGVINNPIRFSGYSLLNILGQCDSGENYEALNSWGMRMADTTITSEQVIYSSVRKRYMNKTVHVFRSFTRLGTSGLNNFGRADMFEVELEDWLLENLNESFVVPEDFNMYRKLVRPTAKGIFVYLYLWFYASQGRQVEKDYAELCALLNIRTYDHVSKIRETIGLSLTDLVNIGYLRSWDVRPMMSKSGYKLILTPGRAMKDVLLLTQRKQLALVGQTDMPLSDSRESAMAALIEKGVSPTKAKDLAGRLEPSALLDRIEFVSHQVESDTRKNIKNPAGYLISFLESDQLVPSNFQTSRQRVELQAKKAHEDSLRARNTANALKQLHLQEEYEAWKRVEADSVIAQRFPKAALVEKLKGVSSQLRREPTVASFLDRLSQEQRRRELMKHLRNEVIRELDWPSFEEWQRADPQRRLFQMGDD